MSSSPKRNVLVIGSSGYLGREIVRWLEPHHYVTPTYRNTPLPNAVHYDFFRDDVGEVCHTFGIDTVVFAAATEKEESKNFETSVLRLVEGCKDKRLVYVSSDAIFGGDKGNYTEQDTPTPEQTYGRNLLHFETRIAEVCPNHCIIRPSYIYGFSGGGLDSRLQRAKDALRRGETLTFFEDMFKSPLGVAQVAEAVLSLGLSEFKGVVHVAGERMSVFDFHRRGLAALNVDVNGLQCEKMSEDARLPRDTSLDTSRWQTLTGALPLSIEETLG